MSVEGCASEEGLFFFHLKGFDWVTFPGPQPRPVAGPSFLHCPLDPAPEARAWGWGLLATGQGSLGFVAAMLVVVLAALQRSQARESGSCCGMEGQGSPCAGTA